MSAEWRYVVPKFFESPWHRPGGSVTRADLKRPNVGLFCPHEPLPWLLGSFSPSHAVLEERGTEFWAWRRDYVTGDGYLIPLGRGAEDSGNQELVDDAPADRDKLREDLLRSVGEAGPTSAEAIAVLRQMEEVDASLRLRIAAKCGICGASWRWRSGSVQQVAQAFWSRGIREVDAATFAAGVARSGA